MANKIGTEYSFIPWLRRGLSRQINDNEKDTLAIGTNEGPALKRANLQVKTTFDLTPVEVKGIEKLENVQRTETLQISLVGPGDVSGLQPISILQAVPANGVKNFESNYFPFIEFFEEDIPWRYTPAKEADDDKLRPWLTLIVCKKGEFAVTSNSEGASRLSLKIATNAAYQEILPNPSEIWKSAHVQFSNMKLENNLQSPLELSKNIDEELNKDEDVAFSRLLSMRNLEDNTAYTAFLIPAFETGRLSGLSLSFDEIPAQRAAWEKSFDEQKTTRTQPLDFPIYYQWEFETSIGSFIDLARKLQPISAESMTSMPGALKVDVQNMGNGLSYATLAEQPMRKVIDVPVATKPINFTSEAFPFRPDEKIIADIMKDLLSKNPTLLENMGQIGLKESNADAQKLKISRKNILIGNLVESLKCPIVNLVEALKNPIRKSPIEQRKHEALRKTALDSKYSRSRMSRITNAETNAEMDDPWIVPPLYGAKHIMATSLEEVDNLDHAWFPELNLDVRHRSAAGLGKKVVQKNQEEFVHRAWEQVELINELNQKLREYLLNLNISSSIYKSKFDSIYLKDLMMYLQPMKYVPIKKNGESFNDILNKNGIPSAYASSAFQRITSSKAMPNISTASLTKEIVDNNAFCLAKHHINDLLDKEQIEIIFNYILTRLEDKELIKYEELWKDK